MHKMDIAEKVYERHHLLVSRQLSTFSSAIQKCVWFDDAARAVESARGLQEREDDGVKVRVCRDCCCNRRRDCQLATNQQRRRRDCTKHAAAPIYQTSSLTLRHVTAISGVNYVAMEACAPNNFTAAMSPIIGRLVTILCLVGVLW